MSSQKRKARVPDVKHFSCDAESLDAAAERLAQLQAEKAEHGNYAADAEV